MVHYDIGQIQPFDRKIDQILKLTGVHERVSILKPLKLKAEVIRGFVNVHLFKCQLMFFTLVAVSFVVFFKLLFFGK
jgi:hypothetical protein